MIKYKLIRMKRKSLTISITDGAVTVKAPTKMPREHIEEFVTQKTGWIEKKLSEYAAKTAFLQDVICGKAALYHGETVKIAVSEQYKRVKLDGGIMYLPVKNAVSDEAEQKAIASYFKRIAKKELEERLGFLSALTGLKYKTFALTNARTKWGSCDAECNIRLNWRLVMLDATLIDYVIIHELSHTAHHDHSAAFWAQVERFYPEYKAARKRLKTYSVLTPLYR